MKKKAILAAAFLFTFLLAENIQAANTPTISTVGSFCFAIKNDDSLWGWEYDDGLLADIYIDRSPGETPIKIIDDAHSIFGFDVLLNNGELWYLHNWDERNESLKPILYNYDVESISDTCRGFLVKKDATLWDCEGYVDDVPIYRKFMNNVDSTAEGFYHRIILKTDGTVWTSGNNDLGQLGTGDEESSDVPIKIMENVKYVNTGIYSSFAITDDNTLWKWGNNYGDYTGIGKYSILSPVKYAENVKQVCPKNGYNLVLKTNGELWMHGDSETATSGIVEGLVKGAAGPYLWSTNKLPYKVMDNVAEVSEDLNGTLYGPELILTNQGELYTYYLYQNGMIDEFYVEVEKVMDDVKIPEDEPQGDKKVYSDINETDVEFEAVSHLSRAGIMEGITETEFMPDKEITRAETAALLLRMTGKGDETGEASFSDVSANDWYYGIAGASQKYGIINGYEDNTFRGNETVSELQLVSLAARTLRNEGTAVEPEEAKTLGAGIVPDWAYEDIEYALNHEIITEAEASNISDKPMTRGEAAVILYRLYNVV